MYDIDKTKLMSFLGHWRGVLVIGRNPVMGSNFSRNKCSCIVNLMVQLLCWIRYNHRFFVSKVVKAGKMPASTKIIK